MGIRSALIATAAAACVGCGLALAGPLAQSGSTVTLDYAAPDLSSQFVTSTVDSEAALPSLDYLDPESALWNVTADAAPLDELQQLSVERLAAQTSVALGNDVTVRVESAVEHPDLPALPVLSGLDQIQLAQAAEQGSAHSILAGADWNFTSWGGVSLLGSVGDRPVSDLAIPVRLQIPGDQSSAMVGLSAHLNFGDGWVTTFSYDEGRTQFDLSPTGLADQEGHGFGMSVSKKGLFDDDTLGFAVIRPPMESAYGLLTSGNDSRLLGSQISLSAATPETDFELGYETSFNGNITLQANAAYQLNVGGQNGTNAVSVLSRAKINF